MGEKGNTHGSCWAILVGLLICLLLGGCFDPDHPDPARYEYLYINGIFQSGYTSFPSGRERENWTCFDGKLRRAFDCTMVRGGWEQFEYIYRKRR
jgi:hypothetical protein